MKASNGQNIERWNVGPHGIYRQGSDPLAILLEGDGPFQSQLSFLRFNSWLYFVHVIKPNIPETYLSMFSFF